VAASSGVGDIEKAVLELKNRDFEKFRNRPDQPLRHLSKRLAIKGLQNHMAINQSRHNHLDANGVC